MMTINYDFHFIPRFFWTGGDSKGRYHSASWKKLCFPYKEGGANFKLLQDIYKAFIARQRWNVRTKDSLWKEYMLAKYCSRSHLVMRMLQGGHSRSCRAV